MGRRESRGMAGARSPRAGLRTRGAGGLPVVVSPMVVLRMVVALVVPPVVMLSPVG